MTQSKYLANLNVHALNAMQTASLEAINQNKDLVLISPTGSGKTLAYLLPIIDLLDVKSNAVQALIIVPTRELAQQIEQVFKQMGTGFKITCCYGGHEVKKERKKMRMSSSENRRQIHTNTHP